ncbi:MAG: ADP-forming succinate--CoA ligase subunit beta [Candidatus Bathyarchaeota archaeon]|nr:ADP-forming succinate--CoA ligase subunit beta [Candidatus Bathyarchaeota archaeon]
MKLLEYQAKKIFLDYGIRTPRGNLVDSVRKAREAVTRLGTVAIKAQVPVGGRGKAGGIQFADSPDYAELVAMDLLGSEVRGAKVGRLLIEEKIDFTDELYLGVTVDRRTRSYVVLASREGGVDIEEVSSMTPERIVRHSVDPVIGLRDHHSRRIADLLGYSGDEMFSLASIIGRLYRVAWEKDAELTEINPLVLTPDGFVALDARLNIDTNALFRHPDLVEVSRSGGFSDLSTREIKAQDHGLTYVELDGNIGIVGNGAGLTMATLDTVTLYGGRPANFLDLGGGASAERIEAGVSFVMEDSRVKAVFVNILGGITRCDDIAKGLVMARSRMGADIPLVVRLVGTNEEKGRRFLRAQGISTLETMEEAAERAVSLVGGS